MKEAYVNPREKIALVADAELVSTRVYEGRACVSGFVLKAVLSVIMAYEGQPIGYVGLGDRAGLSETAAGIAVTALVREGILIRSDAERGHMFTYRISWARLRELRTKTPLFVGLGGSKAVRHDWPAVKTRVVRARRRADRRRRAIEPGAAS